MPPERAFLAFDTSAAHCAAALLVGERILSARAEAMERGQAERLMPFLQDVLADAGLVWANLAGLAVGVGPGNFTGVRIAVSAARGLALGLGIPAVGVTGLQARALGTAGPVRVAIAAPRGDVYAQDFEDGGPVSEVVQGRPDTLAPTPPRQMAGEGWPGQAHDPVAAVIAAVSAMARIAARDAVAGCAPPAPFYLRAADAAPSADPPPVILP